jgi:DNA-binding phage protein
MDIIAHIKNRGMTVAAVARMAGVSRPSVYALNEPDHKPALATVLSVARVIGLKPVDIRPEIGE